MNIYFMLYEAAATFSSCNLRLIFTMPLLVFNSLLTKTLTVLGLATPLLVFTP